MIINWSLQTQTVVCVKCALCPSLWILFTQGTIYTSLWILLTQCSIYTSIWILLTHCSIYASIWIFLTGHHLYISMNSPHTGCHLSISMDSPHTGYNFSTMHYGCQSSKLHQVDTFHLVSGAVSVRMPLFVKWYECWGRSTVVHYKENRWDAHSFVSEDKVWSQGAVEFCSYKIFRYSAHNKYTF